MPIYTYRCENCGIQFERTQKFSDQPLTRCPECGKKELHKVYTPVGIVFKGSGFYSTDNRSSSGVSRSKPAEGKQTSENTAAKDAKSSADTASTSSSSSSSSSEASSSTSSSETTSAASKTSEKS